MGVGSLESGSACCADLVAVAGVLVVGGDVSDGFVQPHGVVVAADAFGLSGEVGGVGERFEVGVLGLDVCEQDSIQAWSVGVEGLPKCWAIEQRA